MCVVRTKPIFKYCSKPLIFKKSEEFGFVVADTEIRESIVILTEKAKTNELSQFCLSP